MLAQPWTTSGTRSHRSRSTRPCSRRGQREASRSVDDTSCHPDRRPVARPSLRWWWVGSLFVICWYSFLQPFGGCAVMRRVAVWCVWLGMCGKNVMWWWATQTLWPGMLIDYANYYYYWYYIYWWVFLARVSTWKIMKICSLLCTLWMVFFLEAILVIIAHLV